MLWISRKRIGSLCALLGWLCGKMKKNGGKWEFHFTHSPHFLLFRVEGVTCVYEGQLMTLVAILRCKNNYHKTICPTSRHFAWKVKISLLLPFPPNVDLSQRENKEMKLNFHTLLLVLAAFMTLFSYCYAFPQYYPGLADDVSTGIDDVCSNPPATSPATAQCYLLCCSPGQTYAYRVRCIYQCQVSPKFSFP